MSELFSSPNTHHRRSKAQRGDLIYDQPNAVDYVALEWDCCGPFQRRGQNRHDAGLLTNAIYHELRKKLFDGDEDRMKEANIFRVFSSARCRR
ncbi:hypothetical protein LDENG_00144320 [Lucifuga dentata]|nr:hypothetical protein LDENG_00144320 [Lucifuga dentata]